MTTTFVKLIGVLMLACGGAACTSAAARHVEMPAAPDPEVGDMRCAPDVTIEALVDNYGAIPPQPCAG